MTCRAEPSVLDVYGRHGAAWAALRSEELVEIEWLDRFTSLLPDRAAILDIGCGSGKPIGTALVRRGYNLTGVDGSPLMLSLFRKNLPSATAHLADMREFALNTNFAGLLAWDSLFHLSPDDQRPMFARFAAHAGPGVVLMFTSGNREGSAIGELEGEALYHGSLDSREYQTLLDEHGFDVLAHTANDPNCGFRTVWLSQLRR